MAKSLAEMVKGLRKENNLSQAALALKVNRNQSTIAQIETGRLVNITYELAASLCSALGTSLDTLGPYLAPDVEPVKAAETSVINSSELRPYPLVGTVGASAADVPDLFQPPQVAWLPMRLARDSFALRVTGDSCEGAGIPEGAIVFVEPRTEAYDGEFVVVGNAEGHMIKGYFGGNLYECRTGQKSPKIVKLSASTRIVGVVIYVQAPPPAFKV